MPPKPAADYHLLCDSTMTESPSSFPRNVLAKHGGVGDSFFGMQQAELVSEASHDHHVYERFAITQSNLKNRVESLLLRLNEEQGQLVEGSSSPTSNACRQSLSTTMPLILRKVALLVDSVNDDDADESKRMVGRLRATFALVNCVQILDVVESAMSHPSRGRFDEVMSSVLERIRNTPTIDDQFKSEAVFRVSHWVAPTLAFDIRAGEVASTSIEQSSSEGGNNTADSLPLSIQVEPVITFTGEELIAGKKGSESFRRCGVVIEKCAHKEKIFSEGAGSIGVVDLRVRVWPLDEGCPKPRIWGEEETSRLYVTEARVVQHNAFPPKPRSHVDLYTSTVYGDPASTARLAIQTYVTENNEPPQLSVELYVASSQV